MRSGLVLVVVVALAVFGIARFADVPLEDLPWWLSNDAAPRVTLEGPATDILRGSTEWRINATPAGRTRVVAVRLDDAPVSLSNDRVAIDTARLSDGQHRLDVTVRDTSLRQHFGNTTAAFASDNTAPRLDVNVDPAEGPLEGHTVELRIRGDEPLQDVRATLNGRDLPLLSDGNGSLWALHGLAPDTPETSLSLQLSAADRVGNTSRVENAWPVHRTTFPEDDIDLAPTASEQQARATEERRLGEVYRKVSGPPLWSGAFRMPVQGPVTTEFGTHRSYEFHPGMDLAAAMGTPVAAPADGVVVMVDTMPARGNIVILDHGAGVFSTYAHLQRADVPQGATVRAGQVIGRVGSTGFSTGPHLHWELWVDGANVDPLDWTRRAYP